VFGDWDLRVEQVASLFTVVFFRVFRSHLKRFARLQHRLPGESITSRPLPTHQYNRRLPSEVPMKFLEDTVSLPKLPDDATPQTVQLRPA